MTILNFAAVFSFGLGASFKEVGGGGRFRVEVGSSIRCSLWYSSTSRGGRSFDFASLVVIGGRVRRFVEVGRSIRCRWW